MKGKWAALLVLTELLGGLGPCWASEDLSPAAVGWGNALVPGLGATLRGMPARGMGEALFEIGTFYGGTYGVKENSFSIDGTINVERHKRLFQPTLGLMLQQIGLKVHMYNSFYHYQQVALEQKDSETQKANRQPLYQGNWWDTLSAPFRWKYLSSPWVYPAILGGSAFLLATYSFTKVKPNSTLRSRSLGESMYLGYRTTVLPLGSSFGEDPFFRGFVQREMLSYTDSVVAALVSQSVLFAFLHQDRLTSFGVGLYLGGAVYKNEGDLGFALAPHFWLNVVDGLIGYWQILRSQGRSTPLNPPLGMTVQIPF